MLSAAKVFFISLASLVASAQATSPNIAPSAQPQVIVAAPGAAGENVIAIPPDTSWSGSISFAAKNETSPSNPTDLSDWVRQQSSLNGLESSDLPPWHIIVKYDQFDADGDNVHSGTFEEFWIGPMKYKTIYKSDNLNQTDFATAQGLFRLGDQRWPNRAEMQVQSEIVNPFAVVLTLQNYRLSKMERTFGDHTLDCVLLKRAPGAISSPFEYCFDHNGSSLRYKRGDGWFQTTYNDIVSFEGRSIGRQVAVTDGGKTHLKLQVASLEKITVVDEKDLAPTSKAVPLQGKRLTGVSPKPLQQSFPQWPAALRFQHFSMKIAVVIGKDGHVLSAHTLTGPPEAFGAAEEAVKKWTFQPTLVLDEPAEVETQIILNNN